MLPDEELRQFEKEREEIERQRKELEAKIQSRKQELKTEAIKQVLTLVKTFDLTLEDCGFRCPTLQDRERARPPIKFVSPDGQAKWSGRGVAPKFFRDALDRGEDLSVYLIENLTKDSSN